MTEPQYKGRGGEVSARLRPASSDPDITYPNGTSGHYLATGAMTGERFGLYRWMMGPGLSGADPHFHRGFSESFFVLSGTLVIYDGSRWRETSPGDFVHVPPGGIHGFRNESGEPASMLIHFAPGAPREAYFEGLLGLSEMSKSERADFYEQHDNHLIG